MDNKLTPLVATSIIWLYIFNPDYGMLNAALHFVGLPASRWLTDTVSAMPAMILYSTWHDIGFAVIIFMAALSKVPTELLEAAQIGGRSDYLPIQKVLKTVARISSGAMCSPRSRCIASRASPRRYARTSAGAVAAEFMKSPSARSAIVSSAACR